MAFEEDPSEFLSDCGLPCSAGGVDFTGLLDQPDEVLQLQHAGVHSRQYELTFITTAVALTRDLAVTVDGQAYRTREAPRQIDDGVFSRVLLTKA